MVGSLDYYYQQIVEGLQAEEVLFWQKNKERGLGINVNDFIQGVGELFCFDQQEIRTQRLDLDSLKDEQYNEELRLYHKLIIDSDFDLVFKTLDILFKDLELKEELSKELKGGLYEIVTNAIEYGNLDISSEEKLEAKEEDRYMELLKQRREEVGVSNKKVIIVSKLINDRLEITVQDEGRGFDWEEELNRSYDIFSLSGRGVLMAREFYDQIKYNKRGNQVKLIKQLNNFACEKRV